MYTIQETLSGGTVLFQYLSCSFMMGKPLCRRISAVYDVCEYMCVHVCVCMSMCPCVL